MFASLSKLGSRIFGGGSPAATARPVIVEAGQDEWASLELDPELATFGAPSPVETRLARSQPSEPTPVAQVATVATETAPQPVPLPETERAEADAVAVALPEFRLMDDTDDADDAGVTIALEVTEAATDSAEVTPVQVEPAAATATAAPKSKRERATAKACAKKPSKPAAAKSAESAGPAKLRRRSGVDLRSPWRMPGVDGYASLGSNDSVETARLEMLSSANS